MPAKQRSTFLSRGDYDISFSGWSPDYPDPLAYLYNFLEGQTYSVDTHYNNKDYNDLVQKGKDVKTDAWKVLVSLKKLKKYLLDDAYEFLCIKGLVHIYKRIM